MTYNLTGLYSGGPIGYAHQLNVISNYIALDVVIVVLYVVLFGIMSSRQANTKNTALIVTWIVFVSVAAFTFGIAAFTEVDSAGIANYVSRSVVTFAIAVTALLWHLLSE